MTKRFTDQQLQAYLDETLASETMSQIEKALRQDDHLRDRIIQLAGAREAGSHGLGENWRRNRVSCPTRQQLGSYILQALDREVADYIHFHLELVGCRLCAANLEDLQRQRTEQAQTAQTRRRRYFQTSAGYLSRRE